MTTDERAPRPRDERDRAVPRRRRFARAGRVIPIGIVQIGGTIVFSHLGRTIDDDGQVGFRGPGPGPGPWNGGAASTFDPIALTPIAIALLVAGVVALLVRYRAPVVVLAVVLATTIGYALVVSPRGPFVAALTMALVNAVFFMHRRDAMIAAAIAVLVLPWADVVTGRSSALPWGTMTFALAWATATISIAELARIRILRGVEARQARADAEHRRAGEERVRIARELHDSVAHNMSLINLQSGVALHLGQDLPASTRESLTNIRDASRDALVELRTVLGVLRGVDDERSGVEPVPGLDRLPDLVDRAKAAGLRVTLDVQGDPSGVGGIVDRSAFRIVQESITNVMKHAAGHVATVRVHIGDDVIDLEVIDLDVTDLDVTDLEPTNGTSARAAPALPDAAGNGAAGIGATGNGLIGMRERATAVGGTFSAGPRPAGGWQVRARLPRDSAGSTGGTAP